MKSKAIPSKIGLITLVLLTFLPLLHAEETKDENEAYKSTEQVMHHIADAHSIHILTTPKGKHISIHLPVILYSKNSGFHVFMSSKLEHEHVYKNFKLMEHGNYAGKIIEVQNNTNLITNDEHTSEKHISQKGEELYFPIDLSLTKNMALLMFAAFFLAVIFISVANAYKKRGMREPKGMQAFLEPIIVFIQEDVAKPNIDESKYERFVPFLLSVFFFILTLNLFGLIPIPPFGANVTGNISVTLVLAVFTFLITQINGTKSYWRHIFATPGLPWWLLPIMIPIEIVGMFSKPFALMVRLFANITAGHIIILSLIGLIFTYQSIWISAFSVPFTLFMDFIELLVAFIQAYVFTLLSALFIGLAVDEGHH